MNKKIKQQLEKLDLIYGIFFKYCQCDNHRDFILEIQSHEGKKHTIILKGVVIHTYENNIKHEAFSMDNKYIEENVSAPINAWHWGIKSFEILNWNFEENTEELKNLSKIYNNYDFVKLIIKISTANIKFVFHDIQII